MDYQKIISSLNYICREYEDIDLIKDVLNSVNSNQVKSKTWLVDECGEYFIDGSNIIIAAGWYGLLGHLIKQQYNVEVTTFDMEPTCADVGKILFPEIHFKSNYIENEKCSGYNIIISTSCEHVEDDVINDFIKTKDEGSIVILQGNNYYGVDGHINCKDSLSHFCESYNLNIIKSTELNMNHYARYMLIGF